MTSGDKVFIRCYITSSLMYRNAQHQGAVINMTLKKWEEAERVDTEASSYRIVSVRQHKTASSHGSARVVVTQEIVPLVECYIDRVRPAPSPGCENLLFLTASGIKLAQTSKDFRCLSKEVGEDMKVTSTNMRKLVSTKVSRKTDGEVSSVAKHMTHGVEMARAAYQQHQGTKNSVKAFELISDSMPCEKRNLDQPEQPTPKRCRTYFTKEQNELITNHTRNKIFL